MVLINRFFKKVSLFENSSLAWLCYLFTISLFFSRAGLAISSVFLLVYAFYTYQKAPFKTVVKPFHYLFFTIYSVYLISYFFSSENQAYGLQLLFKNAVYLVLPLAFVFSKPLTPQALRRCFLLFLFSTVICVSINTVGALLHYGQFLNDVINSKNVEPLVGPSHPELGALSVVAFILGFYLAFSTTNRVGKLLLFVILGFLFIELHIIAYRFSLVCIYAVTLVYFILELAQKRNFKLFFATITGGFVLVYLLTLMPSVQNRLQNTLTDITTISENRNPNFQSITQRVLAIKCAFEVVKQHPWFGVSPANTNDQMLAQYAKNSYLLIPENRIFVHNQFVYYVLSFGIPIGLLVSSALILLVLKSWHSNPLSFWVMLPFLLHMMVENSLDRQITANAFIFLFLIINNRKRFLDDRTATSVA